MDERPPSEHPEPVDRFRASPATPVEADPPHWTLWLVYLVFRPRLFFTTYVLRPVPVLTALTAWLFGIAGTMDRIESRVLLSDEPRPVYALLQSDWAVYWGAAALLGILGGAAQYAIGGWWYRVRLRWSGARDPDRPLARRVYVYAAQAYVVPYLLYTAWETTAYETPAAAAAGDDLAALIVIAALFWSVVVSYRGVRTAFDVRPWPARVWFGILPGAVYALALGAVFAAAALGALEDPPDVANARVVEGAGFRVEVPGNWEVDVGGEDSALEVGPVFADAILTLWLYEQPLDSRECVEQTAAGMADAYGTFGTTPIETWGRFEGAGRRATIEIEGGSYDLVMFCATDGAHPFEIMVVSETDTHARVAPGFDLVRDTLELLPAE